MIFTELAHALDNGWALTFGGGVEPAAPTPSTVLYDEPHRQLRRYEGAHGSGNPVLLVPPLAVHSSCFDLRPGQSLAKFLLDTGRTPYIVDYGRITYADRNLGFEEWIDDIVPTAIARVSAEHGGAEVDVVAWSLGGTLALLTAAEHADLPIASVTALGTPIDYRRHPMLAPSRLLARVTGGREVAWSTALFGGIPAFAVQLGFRGMALPREIMRPWFIARNLGRIEALARMEAIDRFIGRMPGYPGRLYRQNHRLMIVGNHMAKGSVPLGADRVIEMAKVSCRVLLVGSPSDNIAPAATVAPGVRVLTGAAEARYVEVPRASHLGLVAGPEAASWAVIDEFLGSVVLADR
ncbi:alpha/beta hydrolase [Nocardia sp. NPDC004654]|uniref:alpha/beta hydrolase n=1 Tax=Nocardia sp. NPDC004654 TaxID=3154776 RepID=UPI0033AB1048